MKKNPKIINPIMSAAKNYTQTGLAVFPADKTTKMPLVKWGRLRKESPSKDNIIEWFSKEQSDLSIAIVCGKGSGNLEAIDFDLKGMMFKSWKKIVERRKPTLFKSLIIEQTQNGGFHVVYRSSKSTIDPSRVLAYPGDSVSAKRKVAIETRGEGGYFLCSPSPGYSVIQGDFSIIPDIAPKDRKFLIRTAESLNQWIDPNEIEKGYMVDKKDDKGGKLPGQDFDQRGDIRPILERHEWKAIGKGHRKFQHYRRPGKNKGYSASLIDGKIFQCFTTNGSPFKTNKAYGPFAVYGLLEHDGDFKKAAKELAKKGYGGQKPKTIEINEKALEKRVKEILDTKRPTERFRTTAFPMLLANYIDELCDQTFADPIIITQSVLCTISAIVGKTCYISDKDYFDTLYGNLWTLTIGLSGTFKTTALNKGSEIALRMRQEILDRSNILNTRLGFTENDKKARKIRRKISKLEKTNPILPEESSIEGLLEVLGQRDGGMIICSEFGDWYEGISRSYKQGFKKLLTSLYDVPEYRQVKTKGSGTTTVHRPYITINAASTLTWLDDSISKREISSGFLARFLLFYPPDIKEIPPARPRHTNRDHHLGDQMKERLESLDRKNPRTYSLEKKAGRLYDSIYDSLYADFRKQGEKTREMIDPFLKRWCPSLLKVAMLLQILEDPNTDLIGAKAIKGAHSIIDYAVRSTVFLLRHELGESEQQKKKAKVLRYIAQRKGKVTKGQLIRSKILDGGIKEYGNIMETLMAEGSVQLVKTGEKEYDWQYVIIH